MTGSDWKHPHIIVLTAATLIAFGGGYALGGWRSPPAPVGPVIIGNEVTAAPPTRARPDENALIAENAEREDSVNRAQPQRAEPRPETPPEPRREPRRPARDTADDRDFVEPGLEGEPPGDKPRDE